MKILFRYIVLIAAVMVVQTAKAQVPAGAPAGTTGICKDGTYSSAASKSGACGGHKGVKEWYAAAAPKAATAAAKPAAPAAAAAKPAAPAAPMNAMDGANKQHPSSMPAPAKTAVPAATPATASAKAAPAEKASAMQPAPGGGPGMVWVNTASNVYHCPGSAYYGKTKAGAYMTEAAAKAKGARGNDNKACPVK